MSQLINESTDQLITDAPLKFQQLDAHKHRSQEK